MCFQRIFPSAPTLLKAASASSLPHQTFGYYAEGASPTTALLPLEWQARLIRVCNPNTRGNVGWCLEIHDLLVSKYLAARPKDVEFSAAAVQHGLCEEATLRERLSLVEVDPARSAVARDQIDFHFVRRKSAQ